MRNTISNQEHTISDWTVRLHRIQTFAQKASLDHHTRNQLNALVLAGQMVVRQSQIGMQIDSRLMSLAIIHWSWFEEAFPEAISDKEQCHTR
jgi:hypothetical protein